MLCYDDEVIGTNALLFYVQTTQSNVQRMTLVQEELAAAQAEHQQELQQLRDALLLSRSENERLLSALANLTAKMEDTLREVQRLQDENSALLARVSELSQAHKEEKLKKKQTKQDLMEKHSVLASKYEQVVDGVRLSAFATRVSHCRRSCGKN